MPAAAAAKQRAGAASAGAVPSTTARGVRRWAAVLFDLDGTLLDIDGEGFLDAYVDALTEWWRPGDAAAFRQTVMAAAVPIFASHPGHTNGEVFREHLAAYLGMTPNEIRRRIHRFHWEDLPSLRFAARAIPDARVCVTHCLKLGLRIAVATSPMYMPEVIELRLRWAGLADLPWDLVTHSEIMRTCKPHAAYFSETAAHLGLDPHACMMVGDDPLQDGPAREVGMAVLLRETTAEPGWRSFRDVSAAVTRGAALARRADQRA